MIHKNGLARFKKISAIFTLSALFIVTLIANTAIAALEDDIRARISPAGQVCVMGEECAGSLAVATAGSGEPQDPQTIYQTSCFACHGTGVNNAPVLGDVAAWGERIEKGMDILYESAFNGFNNNAMPARGLCMTCSDDDLRATVDLMVEAAQ